MDRGITPAALFESHRQRLGLVWVAGRDGASRPLPTGGEGRGDPLLDWVGGLNLARPPRVPIIGRNEAAWLDSLGARARADVLERILAAEPPFLVIADGVQAPDDLRAAFEAASVPLLASPLPVHAVVVELRHSLADVFAERVTIHGVFMAVLGIGVLITGESGIGKSEVALELISRGHRLIADDTPEFRCIAPDTICGRCSHPVLSGFLEVRGLGVLDIRAMYGDTAIKSSKALRLVIELKRMNEKELIALDRLEGSRQVREILGVSVPQVTIPVIPSRNLAVLVESAISNQILLLKGYSAAREFAARQQRLILDGA